jgi:hypothetical protein
MDRRRLAKSPSLSHPGFACSFSGGDGLSKEGVLHTLYSPLVQRASSCCGYLDLPDSITIFQKLEFNPKCPRCDRPYSAVTIEASEVIKNIDFTGFGLRDANLVNVGSGRPSLVGQCNSQSHF